MRFGFRTLSTSGLLLASLAIAGCGQAPPAAPANPLAGAWIVTAIEGADGTVINPAQAGLFIFADRHYSATYTSTADARPASATTFTATDAEALEQFRSFVVNTGTYTVSGSTIMFRPLVARSPEFIGGEATAEFEIAGDVLTLRYAAITAADGTSAPNVGGSMTLRRAE